MFTAALLTRPKTWKQSKCPPTDEWIKMWYLHTLEDYSVIKKKKELTPFAVTWMQSEIITSGELSQKRKDKYQYDITFTWHLKYGTNESICETERDSQTRKQICGCQVGGRVGEGWTGSLRLAELHKEWINNKVLRYSTGNYSLSWDTGNILG